jgi:hypothetical protein
MAFNQPAVWKLIEREYKINEHAVSFHECSVQVLTKISFSQFIADQLSLSFNITLSLVFNQSTV